MSIRAICLWSGPRNVSTALMYSFRQRSDTRVVDEPLYGHYLRVSGARHPGGEDVLAAMDTDGERVMRRLLARAWDRPVVFVKQMAHHLEGLDTSFLKRTRNVLLIRDPGEMLPSLVNQIPEPTLRDTALARQCRLHDELAGMGQQPPVLDARELLSDPESVLRQLCGALDIAFDPAMLAWPAGPKPEDGVWAPHWYHNVHRSTGFQAYRARTKAFPERLRPLLEECTPYYRRLYRLAFKARP
jgi:hypothetical protein